MKVSFVFILNSQQKPKRLPILSGVKRIILAHKLFLFSIFISNIACVTTTNQSNKYSSENIAIETLLQELRTPSLKFSNENALYTGKLDFELIEKLTKLHNIKRLYINSGGGDTDLGIKIGHWVYDNKVEVYVRFLCASSCANYIFPAAPEKFILNGAAVVWHGNVHSSQNGMELEIQKALANLPISQRKEVETNMNLLLRNKIENEKAFFKKIGINGELCSQQFSSDAFGYTMSLDLMKSFGVGFITSEIEYTATDFKKFNKKIEWLEEISVDRQLKSATPVN